MELKNEENIEKNNSQNIMKMLLKLESSKFRSSFHLKKCDFEYIDKKGIDKIVSHAYDFIEKRLSSDIIPNDGKQTPMRGHPVFIAQHATATCCRGCLEKWHHIPKDKILTEEEVSYIVDIILSWITKEYNSN